MHRLPRALQLRRLQGTLPRTLYRPQQVRTASQYVFRSNGDRLRYQSVRFRPANSSVKTFGSAIITAVTLAALLRYVFHNVLTKLLEDVEDEEEQTAEVKKEGEKQVPRTDAEMEEDDPLIIPLTWATQQPRTFYKGSDPEWEAFHKFSHDMPRREKVERELIDMMLKLVIRNPSYQRRLGDDIKVGEHWLETHFPEGPPPDYQRTAIAVGDGYIALVQETIDDKEHREWMRRIWPTAAINSTVSAVTVLAGMEFRRLKQALGLEAVNPLNPEERMKKAFEIIEQRQTARDKPVSGAQTDPVDSGNVVVDGAPAPTPPASRGSSDPDKKASAWSVSLPAPSTETKSPFIPVVLNTWSNELRKHWGPTKMEAPRGSLVIAGLIEYKGTRGRITIDVQACYDPIQSKFVFKGAKFRSYRRRHQGPRGGP